MADPKMVDLLRIFNDEGKASKASSCGACGGNHDLEEECTVEEVANSASKTKIYPPKDVINPQSNDLNKEKSSNYSAKASPGDPPKKRDMSEQEVLESRIKAELTALYKL